MTVLNKKIDFALVFRVKNANPNGDPLGGNRPRTTSDGLGEVSDVCLKRKVRNRLMNMGYDIYVQSNENIVDGYKSLSERYKAAIKEFTKDDRGDKGKLTIKLCEKWLDVRFFGQVFAFKSKNLGDEVSLGVRGPITIQSAFSIEPVVIESIQITKSANSETTETGKKSSDTMGMKHRVSNSVYVTYGSISPQLAEKTGFSSEDALVFKKALSTLFLDDESSARPSGSMEVLQVVWWEHESKTGNYSSAKVHNSMSVNLEGKVSISNLPGLIASVIEG